MKPKSNHKIAFEIISKLNFQPLSKCAFDIFQISAATPLIVGVALLVLHIQTPLIASHVALRIQRASLRHFEMGH